jgi:hypothetical protein
MAQKKDELFRYYLKHVKREFSNLLYWPLEQEHKSKYARHEHQPKYQSAIFKQYLIFEENKKKNNIKNTHRSIFFPLYFDDENLFLNINIF